MPDFLHVDTAPTIDESAGADPDHPLYDPDARLGGNDTTMLEALHEQAEEAKPSKGSTRYLIEEQLQSAGDEPAIWGAVERVDASSARDAIRRWARDHNPRPGVTLRAIPVRNITQVQLDVETTTRFRLS